MAEHGEPTGNYIRFNFACITILTQFTVYGVYTAGFNANARRARRDKIS